MVKGNNSLLCVGLDSDGEKLPASIKQFEFNRAIIDATKDLVCAYKPNMAFYEAYGIDGLKALKKTIEHIPSHIPVILDAKRGDIGNTSKLYAQSCYNDLKVDAVTLHPYMGSDTVLPFLEFEGKGVFVLVKTSNPSAIEIEDLVTKDGETVSLKVARKVAEWNKKFNGRVGAVVGATYPKDLRVIREILGDAWFLVPGVGAQGGNVREVVSAGQNKAGDGIIINSSREIIFASAGSDFAEKAREKAERLRSEINLARGISA